MIKIIDLGDTIKIISDENKKIINTTLGIECSEAIVKKDHFNKNNYTEK